MVWRRWVILCARVRTIEAADPDISTGKRGIFFEIEEEVAPSLDSVDSVEAVVDVDAVAFSRRKTVAAGLTGHFADLDSDFSKIPRMMKAVSVCIRCRIRV